VGILVAIPAYNAASTLAGVVEETLGLGYPLLVVDDGSTDATADILGKLPVEVIRHERNLGKGAALRSAFHRAIDTGACAVVTLDSDGQHDPSAIPLLVATAEERGFDILIASRSTQFDQMAGLRNWWNRFGVWCMRKRTGFEISDSQSGFRYYSGRLLRSVELSTRGYEMEMEILMKAWKVGFTIGSLPVAARVADGRSTSHFRPVRDTWNICMTFLRYL
jgi:glycosyltransferase involved in cell wall biosynthesis